MGERRDGVREGGRRKELWRGKKTRGDEYMMRHVGGLCAIVSGMNDNIALGLSAAKVACV